MAGMVATRMLKAAGKAKASVLLRSKLHNVAAKARTSSASKHSTEEIEMASLSSSSSSSSSLPSNTGKRTETRTAAAAPSARSSAFSALEGKPVLSAAATWALVSALVPLFFGGGDN